MAKKRLIEKINNKRLVQGDENLLTQDEILVKNEGGFIQLKERVDGQIVSLTKSNYENPYRFFIMLDPQLDLSKTALHNVLKGGVSYLSLNDKARLHEPNRYILGVEFLRLPDGSMDSLTKEECIQSIIDNTELSVDDLIEITEYDYYSNAVDAAVYLDREPLLGPNLGTAGVEKLKDFYDRCEYLYKNPKKIHTTIVSPSTDDNFKVTGIEKSGDAYLLTGMLNGQPTAHNEYTLTKEIFTIHNM